MIGFETVDLVAERRLPPLRNLDRAPNRFQLRFASTAAVRQARILCRNRADRCRLLDLDRRSAHPKKQERKHRQKGCGKARANLHSSQFAARSLIMPDDRGVRKGWS